MRDSRSGGPRARRTRARPRVPGSPAAARPTARRPTGRAGETTRTSASRPAGGLTGRAVILAVVLVALGLSYIFPLRVYLSQQAEISAMRAAQDAQREHIAELEVAAEHWRDDEFVRIQARRRFHYAEPNEILMVTVWEDEDDQQRESGLSPELVPEQPGAWWDTLWGSVEAANGGDRE